MTTLNLKPYMKPIPTHRTDISLFIVSAGHYYADAGAAMGVLPYKLYHDKIEMDDAHRIKMELPCLLIKTPQQVILVDCGIGSYLPEKLVKIYSPSRFTLIDELQSAGVDRHDVDIVVFTHLHFDHMGGVILADKTLSFPNARYLVQKVEWDTALHPDTLNKGSYSLNEHIQILSDSGRVDILDGDFTIYSGITCECVGGHSPGFQIVSIVDHDRFIVFASDAFPLRFHLNPAVTSAYDICRQRMCEVKISLKERVGADGVLIFGHEI